jgi:TrmH family RNA methyltransferase
VRITSINNQLIKDTTKLHQKKHRDKTGLFLVEGFHLYEEALKSGNIETIFTTDESIAGDNVVTVTQQVLEKLTQTKNPQPILTICKKIYNRELSDKILILEEVQDPGNLGTLMRSALAFGFNTIVLDNTVDIYNDKVLRSTQGAIFNISIIESNTLDFMENNRDYVYYGTEMFGTDLLTISKQNKVAIILGNEGSGLSKKVLEKTTQNITIKMQETESLNVGVAGSIIMHYFNS